MADDRLLCIKRKINKQKKPTKQNKKNHPLICKCCICMIAKEHIWPKIVKHTFPLTSSRKVWLQRSTVAGRRFQSLEQSWDIFQGNWQIISRNIKHPERNLTPANSCGIDLEEKLLNASPLCFLKEMSSLTREQSSATTDQMWKAVQIDLCFWTGKPCISSLSIHTDLLRTSTY